MGDRLTPPLPEDTDQLGRSDLVERILANNEHATFQFSERWLRKQRITRLRQLARDAQNMIAEPTEVAETAH